MIKMLKYVEPCLSMDHFAVMRDTGPNWFFIPVPALVNSVCRFGWELLHVDDTSHCMVTLGLNNIILVVL